MSATPVVFGAIAEPNASGFNLDFADAPAATGKILPSVSTSPMMESRVTGRLSTGADADVVKIHLEKDQILTADVDFSPSFNTRVYGSATPRLTLFNSAGQALAQGGQLGFRILTSGDYYIGMASASRFIDPSSYSASYTMHIRPVGLAGNDLDPHWLSRTEGGIYVWQDGERLNVSGPVGHGFSIRGNWQQTVTGMPGALSSTYRVYDNLVYIQTSVGVEIPLYLDNYGMEISTYAGKFGDLYGEMRSSAIWATSEIVQGIVRKFGDDTPFGMDLSADNMPFTLGEIGLRLGNDPLLQATGAPINAAVPYLYINAGAGVNATSNGSFAGITYNLGSLIVDPADPFLYVASDSYGWSVGLSHHGLIPFTPEKAPSQFNGQLFGHVYVAGEFNLLEVTGLPLSVDGDIVVNLNGHSTGQINGETAAAIASVSSAMTSMNEDAPPIDGEMGGTTGGGSSSDTSLWRNFSVGINANLNVILPLQQTVDDGLSQYPGTDWFDDHPKTSLATEYLWNWLPEDLALTLATASVIYDGPNGGLHLRGGTNNWLEDTDLDFLAGTQVDLDGAWLEGGKFFLDAKGQYGTVGLPAAQGRVVLARDFDLAPEWAALIRGEPVSGTVNTTGGYVELGARVLGSGVTLKGHVQENGDFELVGNAGVNLGNIAGSSLSVKLKYSHATGATFTAQLTGTINLADTVRAKITVNFTLGVDSNGHITYAGTGTAKIEVKTPHTSLSKGVYWTWDDVMSVSIGVNNDAFWFSALGYNVRINLPH